MHTHLKMNSTVTVICIFFPQLVRNLTSRDYADATRAKIWDNQTHPLEYYGATFYSRNTTSTAHLSVIDVQGNAVSVTSTVNTRYEYTQILETHLQ